MAIPNLPSRMIPARRALGIVSKISGISEEHIKEKFKQFDSPEARKIRHNVRKNELTQKEMTSLLQQTKKAGLRIDSNKLAGEYSKIQKEETKRKIQYGQQRAAVSNRLSILKSGSGDTISKEDRLRARIFSTAEISNTSKDAQKQASSQQISRGSWGAPSDDDDDDENKDSNQSGKVIDLPI